MAFNSAVTDIIDDLGVGFFRQRITHDNGAFIGAVDALPDVMFLGHAGQLSDSEATVRNEIAAWRSDARSANLAAILGPNEPNGTDTGFADADAAMRTVRHQFWVWDEVHTGTWSHRPGNQRPLVIGPALKRAGFTGDDDRVYDDSIALLAAAEYTTGGNTYSMDDLCDGLDHHHYDGVNGPGYRITGGVDSYGHKPPSLTLGADGKASRFALELANIQQIAPSKRVRLWSEFGWTSQDSTPSEAQRALFAQESYLRAYRAGVMASIYEAVDEYPAWGTREDYFGIYTLAHNPHGAAGPKPIYTALKKLLGYTGSQSFTGVGWVEPHAGVAPDCGVSVFSKASGGFDLYLLREARAVCDVVTAPGHLVAGRTPDTIDGYGNRRYSIDFGDTTMLTLAVS